MGRTGRDGPIGEDLERLKMVVLNIEAAMSAIADEHKFQLYIFLLDRILIGEIWEYLFVGVEEEDGVFIRCNRRKM